tara:strand:- start:234 stop:512 length:279 start_codon:yes stop_codon:yes gene_type:complete
MTTFTKGQQIVIDRSFTISIGSFNTGDVAIISNFTGQFVMLTSIKKSKRLRKVKNKFKSSLSITGDKEFDTFNFNFMTDTRTQELIDMLKNG